MTQVRPTAPETGLEAGPALTRAQVREVDRRAVADLGIPGVVLMENAARHVARHVLEGSHIAASSTSAPLRVAVLCGGGNNGGDGYAIARLLQIGPRCDVKVYPASDPATLTGDAAVNYEICRRMFSQRIHPVLTVEQLVESGRAWDEVDVMVDALLGTGFSGIVRPHMAAVIERANAAMCHGSLGKRMVAVDVPSGLDCDTGEPANAAIRATSTVTFVAVKTGFLKATAQPYLGVVYVADIGVPAEGLLKIRGRG